MSYSVTAFSVHDNVCPCGWFWRSLTGSAPSTRVSMTTQSTLWLSVSCRSCSREVRTLSPPNARSAWRVITIVKKKTRRVHTAVSYTHLDVYKRQGYVEYKYAKYEIAWCIQKLSWNIHQTDKCRIKAENSFRSLVVRATAAFAVACRWNFFTLCTTSFLSKITTYKTELFYCCRV